jgi:hypothetical protein
LKATEFTVMSSEATVCVPLAVAATPSITTGWFAAVAAKEVNVAPLAVPPPAEALDGG